MNHYCQSNSFSFVRDSDLNSWFVAEAAAEQLKAFVTCFVTNRKGHFPTQTLAKVASRCPDKEFHGEKSAVRNQLMFCLECFAFLNQLFLLSLSTETTALKSLIMGREEKHWSFRRLFSTSTAHTHRSLYYYPSGDFHRQIALASPLPESSQLNA